MSDQLTNFVVMCYKDALEDRGRFAIALTGGQAVTLLARRITEEPFVSYIDWTKWYVFFVDERCTSLDNPCSSYYMVDQALLQHVKIPEMQVFPAYDPMLPLDKRGHTCEAAALAYEQRMRSVLGEEDGFPLLDVVLVGADSAGNVASLFENHPIRENRIRNYEITWGAEGKFRVLGPQQAACALYECPLDLFDVVLSEEERAQCRRRGIPKERVALTVKAINHAQHVLVCITDLESGPLLKEYFEGAKQGELPIFDRAGLNLLQGRSGRPKLFAHRKAIDGFITLPQLLRTFQVQDLAFSITEARGAAAAAAQTSESDSDSEGEEYTRRLEMEEQELASALKKDRNASRQASLRGSKEGSPLAISPLRRQPAAKRLLPTKEATREEGGTFSRANSLTRVGSMTRAGSLGRTRSTASEKGGKGNAEAMRVHGEDTSGDEEEQESMSAVAAKEGQVVLSTAQCLGRVDCRSSCRYSRDRRRFQRQETAETIDNRMPTALFITLRMRRACLNCLNRVIVDAISRERARGERERERERRGLGACNEHHKTTWLYLQRVVGHERRVGVLPDSCR
jgi:6-phosphogluconolactonase/glucosamine-6-phosphate isomerase/deaminase